MPIAGQPGRYRRMAHSAITSDLRNLMAVAIKLREFARQQPQEDGKLYLTTAQALEERAQYLANSLPEDRHDRDIDPHRPVDLIV
jgi:hypothetical protein